MPDPVPAILLGQLAVDRRDQGRGIAESLLYFAFGAAVRAAREIGCYTMLTHPLDEDVRAFYRKYDFADLPGDPQKVMFARILDMRESGF